MSDLNNLPGQINGQLIPQEEGIDFKQVLFLLFGNWWWLVIGLGIGLTIAWLQLRYDTEIYSVSGTVLINDEEQQSFSETALLEEFGYSNSSNILDQIEVLTSSNLMEEVVDSLNLHVRVFEEGRLKVSERYLPFYVKVEDPEQALGTTLKINTLEGGVFQLVHEEDTSIHSYNNAVEIDGTTFLTRRTASTKPDKNYQVRIDRPDQIAKRYANSLNIRQKGRSNVLTLSMNDAQPDRVIDIINVLLIKYNENVIKQKKQAGENTLRFIEERIDSIFAELSSVEGTVANVKRDNDLLLDLDMQAQQFMEQIEILDQQMIALALKESLLSTVENHLSNQENEFKIIPTSAEILKDLPTVQEQISTYNNLIFERQNRLEVATEINPVVKTYDEQLAYLKESILLSINTVKLELSAQKEELQDRITPLERKLRVVPNVETELLQVMRQQKIKESLYLLLLEKREETALSLAAQVADSRMLDEPYNTGLVSPNRKITYAAYGLLGLGLPLGIIILIFLMDNKVRSKEDIEKYTSIPFLGQIMQAKQKESIVVTNKSRTAIAEMFRMLRTNLQFNSATKTSEVFLVSSSVSGEGKTFIAINLAQSMAISGKKTVVVGLDLRKPKLSRYLTGEVSNTGVTNFLTGRNNMDEIILEFDQQENLSLIGSGPIPPNPAELLMQDKTKAFFKELKSRFEVIIVDSAPLGLVTDALLVKAHIDQTIIVTRFGKTTIGFLRMLEDLNQKDVLHRPGVILNGVKRRSTYGYTYSNYGYGYEYGYGYGSSYGSGYYED